MVGALYEQPQKKKKHPRECDEVVSFSDEKKKKKMHRKKYTSSPLS